MCICVFDYNALNLPPTSFTSFLIFHEEISLLPATNGLQL